MKRLTLFLVCLFLLSATVCHAGRTQISKSLTDDIKQLAGKRQELLLQLLNEMTRAKNGGSMMKTTFFGDPMLWQKGCTNNRNNAFTFGDGAYDNRSHSFERKVGSVLLSGTYNKIWKDSIQVPKLRDMFMKAFYKKTKYSDVYTYLQRQYKSKETRKSADILFAQRLGLMDSQDKLTQQLYGKKLLQLFKNELLFVTFRTEFGVTGDAVTSRYHKELQKIAEKHDGRYISAREEWFDKHKSHLSSTIYNDGHPLPKEVFLWVASTEFRVLADGSPVSDGCKRLTKILQGLVEKGVAVHTRQDGYDVYTDAQSENGMTGRILFNESANKGYWEPAMCSYLGNIQTLVRQINTTSDEINEKVRVYTEEVIKDAMGTVNKQEVEVNAL